MAKKGKKSRSDGETVDQEMAEIEEMIGCQEQIEEKRPEVDLEMSPEDFFRYTVNCRQCGDRISKIGEIKVAGGFILDFGKNLYREYCETCIKPIADEAESDDDKKGWILNILEAEKWAKDFFRDLAWQDELSDEFCIECNKPAPVDKPTYYVITGLPRDMWWEKGDSQDYYLQKLVGKRLCPHHGRIALLISGFRTIGLEKYLEKTEKKTAAQAEQEAKDEGHVARLERFNQRGSLDYSARNGGNGGRQKQNTR